jgi:hypothetical protein
MPLILDVAIGTIFVFLLFSLVVTALNEIILSALDLRAAFLKEGLQELLGAGEPGAKIGIAELLNHGLISALSRGKYGANPKKPTQGVPSYIPGKSFVLAILSLVDGDQLATDLAALKTKLDALPNTKLKHSLLALYADANGDAQRFKANIENWFNESMDRVGGWYKRKAQTCLFWLALGLAVVCNVDSLRIIRTLSTDPKLRESMVAQATSYAAEHKPPGGTPAKIETASDAASAPSPGGTSEKPTPSERIDNFKNAIADLGATGIPMGWTESGGERLLDCLPRLGTIFSLDFWTKQLWTEKTPASGGLWLAALAGWVVTALAASLGAPFWFDTLNRIIDIRANGRAPEEKDTTAKKRKAATAEAFLQTGDSE